MELVNRISYAIDLFCNCIIMHTNKFIVSLEINCKGCIIIEIATSIYIFIAYYYLPAVEVRVANKLTNRTAFVIILHSKYD